MHNCLSQQTSVTAILRGGKRAGSATPCPGQRARPPAHGRRRPERAAETGSRYLGGTRRSSGVTFHVCEASGKGRRVLTPWHPEEHPLPPFGIRGRGSWRRVRSDLVLLWGSSNEKHLGGKILCECQTPFLAPALSGAGPGRTQRRFWSSSLTPPHAPGPRDGVVHLQTGPAAPPGAAGHRRRLRWKPAPSASLREFLLFRSQRQQCLPGHCFRGLQGGEGSQMCPEKPPQNKKGFDFKQQIGFHLKGAVISTRFLCVLSANYQNVRKQCVITLF